MAKNFILQLASLATLLASVPAFIVLLFGIINLTFPDVADYAYFSEGAREGIRFSIATLVIFFPAYIVLTRMVNRARREEGSLYHTLTKWVIYIALLVAGLIMLGDLVSVVYTFLEGDLTIRFMLKALVMFLVIGAAFWYYVMDAKGYWNDREKQSLRIGYTALTVVIIFVVYGFTMIETPQEVREQRIDDQQVSDLQDIQYHVEAYFDLYNTLPNNIEDAYDGTEVPESPEGRQDYSYRVNGVFTYELCATFVNSTPESEKMNTRSFVSPDFSHKNYNWEHGEGKKCFVRTVSANE